MTFEQLEELVTELTARIDSLEETVENLRYEGTIKHDPYMDDLIDLEDYDFLNDD